MNNFLCKIFFLTYLLLLNNGIIHSQSCTSSNTTFKDGEELTYVVSYNWFIVWTDVGELKLKIKKDEYKCIPSYQLIAKGETYKSWDWFFKVRDIYQTWVDSTTLKPLYFSRNIKEGSYFQLDSYHFDFSKGIALSEYKVKDNPLQTSNIPITSCTFDILSAYLYARNIDFTKYKSGDKIPVTIVLDKELYTIYYTFQGTERKKFKGLGEFNSIKFSVMLIQGTMFNEDESLFMWVTNDKNRIPLYIESPILIGSVQVRLTDLKGIRYPLSSYIK